MDLIERQAATDAIFEQIDYDGDDEYFCGIDRGLETAKNIIKELPALQPEQFRCQKCRYKDLPVCRANCDLQEGR